MNKETLPTRGAETLRVEPFSGNALYYHRGMRQMDGYMTVKEVCALTGLTGKHLYYFHHEHIVRAVAYANYSVEGNDGYKLYDEAGVEKLRQIALFYRLGLKRNEIRDMMRMPGYDLSRVLPKLLEEKLAQKRTLECQIAVLSYLTKSGSCPDLSGVALGGSIEKLWEQLAGQNQAEKKCVEILPEDSPVGV